MKSVHFCLCIVVLLLCYDYVLTMPAQLHIAALIDSDSEEDVQAFQTAIDEVNSNSQCLARGSTLSGTVIKIYPRDSFGASQQLCRLMRTRAVAGVFGPQVSAVTARHIQSLCGALRMPHFETRWHYPDDLEQLSAGGVVAGGAVAGGVTGRNRWSQDNQLYPFTMNLYPNAPELNTAYTSLIKEWANKQFVVVYETDEGLLRLQHVLTHFHPPDYNVFVARLPDNPLNDFRPFLKTIRRALVRHMVVDCRAQLVPTILNQAAEIGMTSEYYSFMFTTLDLHLVDLAPYQRQQGRVNITGLRLLNEHWQQRHHCVRGRPRWQHHAPALTTTASLLYDAVHMFARALTELSRTADVEVPVLDCKNAQSWFHNGSNIMQHLLQMRLQGRSGLIELGGDGQRHRFSLDVLELSAGGLRQVGTWSRVHGANYTRTWNQKKNEIATSMTNRIFRVVVAKAPPYVMDGNDSNGNPTFKGFCIDLIMAIAKKKNFSVVFHHSRGNTYGTFNEKTGPTGMIKELMQDTADMAIADLSITLERERGVDFSMPWMNLGISILYRKPIKESPKLFSFLGPLSPEVWIYMGTAYLGVSVLLFILARLSPSEWQEPSVCSMAGAEPDYQENEMNLRNSFWFTIGSLMQQGCDINPKAISTRMVATWWWIFTLIMISSYTANLAAFLTAGRMETPIKSAEDLAKQTTIKYGCLKTGASKLFFRDSDKEHYQRMYNFMETARPSVYVDSSSDGVKRVQEGNYAFLMESSSIEYILERHCDLTQIGGLLDHKSYGIALQPGSPYTPIINSAILEVQEEGTLLELKNRWWKGNDTKQCKTEVGGQANDLGIGNVGGVFVVLIAGMCFSVLIAIGEFVWKSRKLAHAEHTTLIKEMAKELRFALSCGGSTKPMTRPEPIRPVPYSRTANSEEYISFRGGRK